MRLREGDLEKPTAVAEDVADAPRKRRRRLAGLVRWRPLIGTAVRNDGIEAGFIDDGVKGGLRERGAQIQHIPVNASHGRQRRVFRTQVRDTRSAIIAAHDVREA